MGARGELTEEIKSHAAELLVGYEITTRGLRLLPYIQYCLVNNESVQPNRINAEEREILSLWQKIGWISNPASALEVTKEFWDAMHELLWLGCVCHD